MCTKYIISIPHLTVNTVNIHNSFEVNCHFKNQTKEAEGKDFTYSCSRDTSPLKASRSMDWISFLYK